VSSSRERMRKMRERRQGTRDTAAPATPSALGELVADVMHAYGDASEDMRTLLRRVVIALVDGDVTPVTCDASRDVTCDASQKVFPSHSLFQNLPASKHLEAKTPPTPQPENSTESDAKCDASRDVTCDAPQKARADIQEVFEHWAKAMGKTRTRLTKDREGIIRARLAEGATVEELKRVADVVSKDPWWMGENDRGRAFNGIRTIYKSADSVERFLAPAKKTTVTHIKPPAPIWLTPQAIDIELRRLRSERDKREAALERAEREGQPAEELRRLEALAIEAAKAIGAFTARHVTKQEARSA